MGAATDDNTGHRERLRERLAAGDNGLLDYELLEYLLTLGRPRVDTKPIAKALLREFGSIAGVLTADYGSLKAVTGVGETAVAAIKVAHGCAIRFLQAEVKARPVLGNWQALLDYLRADMAHLTNERVRVLHLDTRNALLRDEAMSEGTIDEAAIYTREVIRRALAIGSAALILVHNHPSGDPAPSKADIDVTRAIAAAGKPLKIAVHDHLIIGTKGHASLRAMGLI